MSEPSALRGEGMALDLAPDLGSGDNQSIGTTDLGALALGGGFGRLALAGGF